ncbi:MAG: hypothetical protein A3G87_09305 [Omnitrophica bacterium RIFCSPLOWO2_12_FULL_50_11]|nr:MAG: hypothetical protein A3G87_09305 [Omnitrophica bacterium RIFCSPLOWO2_12_FULL_50_11]
MKKRRGSKKENLQAICGIAVYRDKTQAEDAVRLLQAAGVRAELDTKAFGQPETFSTRGTALWVWLRDRERTHEVLDFARRFARPRRKFQKPAEEGTVEFVDMMVHDCRQYLLIAEGKIKDIAEEGELELDDPTNDLFKIAIRLKRLKDQCMRQAGGRPLDWQHGGGLGRV